MKCKIVIYNIFLLLLCGQLMLSSKVKAANIIVNKTNFPDEYLREIVSKKIDKNKDGILTKKEMQNVKKVKINKGKEILDIKGISLLQNVSSLEIEALELKNKTEWNEMAKLRKLKITLYASKELEMEDGISNIQELQLNIPQLEKIRIRNMWELKNLLFLEKDNLCEINIFNAPKLAKLNLSNMLKLEKLIIRNNDNKGIKKVNLNSVPELKELVLCPYKGDKINLSKLSKLCVLNIDNKKIKSINLKKFPDLKKLKLTSPYIRNVNLKKVPKMEVLSLDGTSLKKINLSKIPTLKNLSITNCKAITQLNLKKNRELKCLKWEHGALKKIKWGKKEKLEKIFVKDNNLSGTLKLDKFSKLDKLNIKNNNFRRLITVRNLSLYYVNCECNNLKLVDLFTCNVNYFKGRKNPDMKLYLDYKDHDNQFFDKSVIVRYREPLL